MVTGVSRILDHGEHSLGELTKQAVIGKSREAVFKFVSDPHNAPLYIGSINRIISGPDDDAPTVGQSWQAEANFLGRNVTVALRLADLSAPRLVRFILDGEPQASMTLQLAQGETANSCMASLSLEVPSVPTILLSGLMGNLLVGDLDRLKQKMAGT